MLIGKNLVQYSMQSRSAFISKLVCFSYNWFVCPIPNYQEWRRLWKLICFSSNSPTHLFATLQKIMQIYLEVGLFFIHMVCFPISNYHVEYDSIDWKISLFYIQLVCLLITNYHAEYSSIFWKIGLFFIQLVCLSISNYQA